MLLQELWQFMRTRKKYWMLPIVVMMIPLSLLIIFSQTAVFPFVYTLF